MPGEDVDPRMVRALEAALRKMQMDSEREGSATDYYRRNSGAAQTEAERERMFRRNSGAAQTEAERERMRQVAQAIQAQRDDYLYRPERYGVAQTEAERERMFRAVAPEPAYRREYSDIVDPWKGR